VLQDQLNTVESGPEPEGACSPDRFGFINVNRVRLRMWEWGPVDGPLVLCAHGAADHGRMWDGFAPKIAATGRRVVALDMRGHGDSSRLSAGELWVAAAVDLCLAARKLSDRPAGLIGHSWGGGEADYAAALCPDQFDWVVNIDGLGPPDTELTMPDLAEAARSSVDSALRLLSRRPRVWAGREEMAERRSAMNPRLSSGWIRHLVEHGTRPVEGGWVWKLDPLFNLGVPNDFDPDRLAEEYGLQRPPLLVVTGAEADNWSEMSEDQVEARLCAWNGAMHRRIAGAGHYVHIEQPDRVMAAVTEFLSGLEL
jgi:pimeloyl-ACP methyl ester carboxylesterase